MRTIRRMRNWFVLGSLSILAACGSDPKGSGGGVTCGAGTTQMGDMCVSNGSGSNTTCGAGTHLDGTTCVPDGPGTTGAPTISAMTPTVSGVSGYVLFQITGTGFAGADVTDLHVFFGDTANANCEAVVGAATDTILAGEVPPACDLNSLNATVTVSTNKGMATTAFQYVALFAADGTNFDQAAPGDVYVVDPYAGLSYDLGVPADTNGNSFNFEGIAFSATSTLLGVTTGASDGDLTGHPQLVSVELAPPNDGVVTVLGELKTAANHHIYMTDIKLTGTTLYGWGYDLDSSPQKQAVWTINTTTGAVTALGTPVASTYGVGGLAIDGTGAMVVAANGAGADSTFSANGEFDTVNTTTGALTSVATLDYPIGAPIDSMEYIGTTLYGVAANGYYGVTTTQPYFGESLVVIDPTATTDKVGIAFELPAQVGAESWVSGLALAPTTLAIARHLDRTRWKQPAHSSL